MALPMQPRLFGLALNAFWKRALHLSGNNDSLSLPIREQGQHLSFLRVVPSYFSGCWACAALVLSESERWRLVQWSELLALSCPVTTSELPMCNSRMDGRAQGYRFWTNETPAIKKTTSNWTRHGGSIGRTLASNAEHQEFHVSSNQTNDLQNWFLLLLSLALGIKPELLLVICVCIALALQ